MPSIFEVFPSFSDNIYLVPLKKQCFCSRISAASLGRAGAKDGALDCHKGGTCPEDHDHHRAGGCKNKGHKRSLCYLC